MEDIAADDDLLSDMLLDSLEFEPKIVTHKMNQTYRSPRYKTSAIIDVVRYKIVIDGDLHGALEALCNVDVIKKHLTGKSQRQRHEFQQHARRYLEAYMPDSGVEFAITTRYKQAARRFLIPSTVAPTQPAHTPMADLCVVATKPFKAGDLIMMCKGGVKDLTKSEDDALREEAALGRERRKEEQYAGVLGAGRDFSVIRSARKGCSQLLLGPARFVNHDCDPNCEFHRIGQSHMVFRCLRNVGLNEEITTYYGDNYFETDNAECMCRTCEARGQGVFSTDQVASSTGQAAVNGASAVGDSGQEPATKRRISSRKVRSPPPSPKALEPTVVRIERNGKLIEKTLNHYISQREFDPDMPSAGPKCTCLTCGTFFWAPEAWWMPDECRRCERHFKIFQSDWPARVPTEPKWNAIYLNRRAQREEAEAQRKASLSASTSDTDTPVKMSPLRDVDDMKRVPSKGGNGRKVRRIEELSDDEPRKARKIAESSDVEVEEALQSGSHPRITEEDDLSDLTTVSSTSSRSESPASDTPKMLGKHGKTETLAMYWGAPASDKRPRKQRLGNGLESLSDTVRAKKHRRTASDMSSVSTARAAAVKERSSSGTILAGVSSSSQTLLESKEAEGHKLLATVGPERTSVKNLAMAWGAGVEDGSGRGGRRRTPRESLKNDTSASQSPKPTSSIEENGGSPRPASDSDRMEICSPKLSPPPAKPLLIEQNASYSITNHANNIDADARLTPPARLPSPVHQPLARFEMSPPVTFAARPGVVPGQPIRKNLRWGKGKVTTSRPMVATSPLAGPAAYSGTPTTLKTEENTDRQPTPPDTKPSLVDPPASFS